MEEQGQTAEQKEIPVAAGGVPQGTLYNMGNPVFTCSAQVPSAEAEKPPHPMYRTTSQDYGKRKATIHDVPTCFYAKSQQFSAHLGTCGMYRNYSLNTAVDTSKV